MASTAAPILCRNRLLPLCHPMGPSTQNRNEERSSSVTKEVLTQLPCTGHRQPRDNKEPENTQHKPRWATELPLKLGHPTLGPGAAGPQEILPCRVARQAHRPVGRYSANYRDTQTQGGVFGEAPDPQGR